MHARFKVVAATSPLSRTFAAIAKSTRANVRRIMALARARGHEATSRRSMVERLSDLQQFAALYMHRRFGTPLYIFTRSRTFVRTYSTWQTSLAMALVSDVGVLVYDTESRYPLSLIGSDWFVDNNSSSINVRRRGCYAGRSI